MNYTRVAGLAAGAAVTLACAATAQGAKVPAQLPSPSTPLDRTVPLGEPWPILQLPPGARVESREQVGVDVTPAGDVVGVRVLQRLVVRGIGDYYFVVPAPLRDVKAGPRSDAEPGLRRNGILWQGFANRRRVLSSDALLRSREAAPALPLRLELRTTVDGRPIGPESTRSGRLELALRLTNATAVRADAFTGPASRAELRPVLDRIASAPGSSELEQVIVHLDGRARRRPVLVDAPLRVHGEVRLAAAGLTGAVVQGATVDSSPGRVVLRFERLLGGPEPSSATISLRGTVRGASAAQAVLTADPKPVLPGLARSSRSASGPELLVLAVTSMLRLARVAQYEEFLANPAPDGPSSTVYRYRTVAAAASAPPPARHDGDGGAVRPVGRGRSRARRSRPGRPLGARVNRASG